MVEELHLEGTELELYALIYGFSENGDIAKGNGCFLSLDSMGRRLGKKPNTIHDTLRKLQDKDLLLRIDIDGQKIPCYKAIRPDNSQDSLFQADIALPAVKAEPAKRFVPPTVQEVQEFMRKCETERGIKFKFTAYEFYSFYEVRDWCVGNRKMKDWRKVVAYWYNRDKGKDARKAQEEAEARERREAYYNKPFEDYERARSERERREARERLLEATGTDEQ